MSTHPLLSEARRDYLALRRALEFKLASAGRLLGQFVRYLDEHGAGTPTIEHALAWASLAGSASDNWRAIRLSAVRASPSIRTASTRPCGSLSRSDPPRT
jgi:hypothetical protein